MARTGRPMGRPRGVIEAAKSGLCYHCGAVFDCQRETARFCGAACRVANHRAQKVSSVALSASQQATKEALDRVETWRL